MQYGYDDVKPREYIEHVEEDHCPLDKQATKEAQSNYIIGWERNNKPLPEGIKKFAKRLDEEQTALRRDGITISDTDKKDHYLVEVFQSGVFPAATIREWKTKPTADKTYDNVKDFFQDETKGLKEVHHLMGDSTSGNRFESAVAAIEDGLDTMLEKFNEMAEDRIRAAVDTSMKQMMTQTQPTDSVNATAEKTITALQHRIEILTSTVNNLQREVKTLTAKRDHNQR